MATSLSIPVFELKPFARLKFYKGQTLKAGEHTLIKLPEINNGNITVQLVNKPGNSHAGTSVIPSGRNAYLSILHRGVKVTDEIKLIPALDGSGIVRTANAFAKIKDGFWEVYLENKSQENNEYFPDGEPFFVLLNIVVVIQLKLRQFLCRFGKGHLTNSGMCINRLRMSRLITTMIPMPTNTALAQYSY